ncbi:MAG: radical SAM protein [Pseudomonadota bacterium]
MKIALINPRVESYSSTLPPIGLLYIAAVLERGGFKVRVFDIHPCDDRDIPNLLSYDPDIVGMTVLTDYWSRAKHIADIIHKNLGGSLFVAGGVHVTVQPEQGIRELDAHVGVLGEGEYTMLELCRHLADGSDWRDTKGIVFRDATGYMVNTPPRPYIQDLDELPPPARHLLTFENYLVPPGIIRGHWSEKSTTVMTSRGCPFSCIWCGSNCTFGRKVRYRSVDNVLDELELLVRNYSIDTIWFCDDTFTLLKSRVLEFCEKILDRGIKLNWGCQAHIKTADEEMFKAMKKAGLVQLDFGVESGSDNVLKGLKKKSDAESIQHAFKIAKRAGVRTLATFMFGNPSEKEEDIEATFKLAKTINPNFVSSYFLTPYPGTELMQMIEANKWKITGDRDSHGLKKGPMLQIYFSDEELIDIRKRFQRTFVLRNFFSVVSNPIYLFRIISLLCRYPGGILRGMRRFMRTLVFDDLFFEFLNYYVEKRNTRSFF